MFEVGTLYRGQLESFNTLELAYECANSYGLNEMWDKDDQVIVTEDNVPIDAFRPTSEFREISHTNSLTVDTHQATLDTSAHNPLATKDLQMNATAATVTPEIAAAMDVRVLDVIENVLMDYRFNNKLIDDLVLSIQEYLKSTNSSTQAALALIAEQAKLRGVFKIVQQVKNSQDFLDLVKLNTPDENIATMSAAPFVNGEIIAAGTTATEVIKSKPDATVDEPESSKPKAKAKNKLPMPSIASLSELESLAKDRRRLVDAVKAVKSNRPDVTLRANAATVELTKLLAKEVLGIEYIAPTKAAKASKAAKGNSPTIIKKEDIDLATLTWEGCRDMSYRQLQQVCGALKSQKLFSGNCGGKGATKDNFMKGIADYFRSQGVDIVEVALTESKTTSTKPLNLPNLERAFADRAAQVAVAA